jgi:hypothetical protein
MIEQLIETNTIKEYKMRNRIQSHIPPIVILILVSMSLIAGCGHIDPPTASQPTSEESMGLWNPQPGDHVFPGDEIPMLNPGYWESEWGMAINPANLPILSQLIGTDGGVIHLGRHTLTVPAGAVSGDINFTFAIASVNAVALDCGPTGLTFQTPVTLQFSYQGTQYDHMDNPDLRIYYAAPDGTFEWMPSVVDPVNRTVTTQLNHFSRYILTGAAN